MIGIEQELIVSQISKNIKGIWQYKIILIKTIAMGICKSIPVSPEDLPTMDSSGHKQSETVIKEDATVYYDENKIIIIQALYRGHKVRKSLLTTLQSPETSAPTQVEPSKFCFDPNQLHDYDQSSILMKNGAIYTGEWKDGKANGKGKYQLQDSYVEGTWTSNELQGEAVYVNGTEMYKGQWLDSMFHGIGEYVYSDGRIYQGEWRKGLQHGMGKEIYKDKSIYEGKFKEGMKNGLGIIKLSDGCIYEGDFENDQFHGYGIFIWTDRNKFYEGQWKNGSKHGNGTMKWGDGRIYSGQYKEGLKHGYGEMQYQDGRCYKGQWKCGLQDGIGIFIDKQGKQKKGFWVKGKLKQWL
ncbi:unnamed protein product [Paramecium sonneborni]|uniref:MORN repeat protein n=1 Tax=Paramecium sonneborni TaxID=65129 RepID=A0A8S1QCD9_9CILI|nr:unnamed protein product [Paramecium sonneborni]